MAYDATATKERKEDPAPLSDEEFLKVLKAERESAIGFEVDEKITTDRETALNYYKGEMPDVVSLDNRSKAVSSDVADAVETALPDLIEIFTGGDDVLAFLPTKEEDQEAAEQETDYLRHVIMQENAGFLLLYTLIKDALLSKIGVASWWWEPKKTVSETRYEGKNAVEMQLAAQGGELKDQVEDPPRAPMEGQAPAMPTYSFTLVSKKDESRLCIMAIPPDDFSVARDTVILGKDTTYAVMRSRPRAQELIAEGVAAEKVSKLSTYEGKTNSQTDKARDTVDETEKQTETALDTMRQVEVETHFIRLLGKDQKNMETWRVRTDAAEGVLLDKVKVSGLNFAAITPFPQTHRFYGRSMADLLLEIQRITTALTRALLDSAYFALNQRMIVADDGANSFTMDDLLRPEPGLPIRVKKQGAVAPVQGSGLGFEPYQALEYFATVKEGRTGVVRNAQGLNPDTLHDTKGGALALMAAAQRRIRLIARIFAETGIKDLYLGVHATIRENCTSERIVKLRGKWVPVDPSKWGERNAMTVEVGLGASGKDHDLLMADRMAGIMDKLVIGQGGAPVGPIVYPENVYNLASDIYAKLGAKKVERYLADPSKPPPENAPQPPKPPPTKEEMQHQRETQKNMMDAQLKQRQQDLDQEAKMRQQDIEAGLTVREQDTSAQVDIATAHISGRYKSSIPKIEFGGQTG